MKRTYYILLPVFSFLFFAAGCSEKDEPAVDTERGIAITGIAVTMEGMESSGEATTRATKDGFSVNTNNDPTKKSLAERGKASWKMDFTLYNSSSSTSTAYTDGSFTGATYNSSDSKWTVPSDKYFPNYKKPQAEVFIYPTAKNANIAEDQSKLGGDDLLAQDILQMAKGTIKEIAHNLTITVNHKHSMLDFVIKDVVRNDISEVKVLVGNDKYTPYKVTTDDTGTGNIEYMLILPESTATSPVVQIKTTQASTTQAITYKQTIGIIKGSTISLGSNNCYCFTLQGADLKISPVTVLNWATGKSLPGEYIAVTAYPTFKAANHANQTFYFYYDNKLKENGSAKLQEIKFNENGECTIKPDGRIVTHIYKSDQVVDIADSATGSKTPASNLPEGKGKLDTGITLGEMVIDINGILTALTTTPSP